MEQVAEVFQQRRDFSKVKKNHRVLLEMKTSNSEREKFSLCDFWVSLWFLSTNPLVLRESLHKCITNSWDVVTEILVN